MPALQRAGGRVGPALAASPTPSGTGTNSSSTVRRCGRRWPSTATGPSCSHGPTGACRDERGLSYLLVDMTTPGIDVRPLRQITGVAHFNEVFLTDVRVPAANLVGAEGEGWNVARTTLAAERMAIGAGGGTSFADVAALCRELGGVRDPVRRQEVAAGTSGSSSCATSASVSRRRSPRAVPPEPRPPSSSWPSPARAPAWATSAWPCSAHRAPRPTDGFRRPASGGTGSSASGPCASAAAPTRSSATRSANVSSACPGSRQFKYNIQHDVDGSGRCGTDDGILSMPPSRPILIPSGGGCATRLPLYRNEQYDFWALSRFQDVMTAHMDPRTFSSAHGTVLEQMTEQPDRQHDDLHGPAGAHGAPPARLPGLHPTPRGGARGLRSRTCAATCSTRRRGGDGFDYVADFGALVPANVIAMLLGVPEADRARVRETIDTHLPPRARRGHGERRLGGGDDRAPLLHHATRWPSASAHPGTTCSPTWRQRRSWSPMGHTGG